MSSAFKPLALNRSGLRPQVSPSPLSSQRVNQLRSNHLRALPTHRRSELGPLPAARPPLPQLSRPQPSRRSRPTTVRQLPTTRPLPLWLHSLMRVQKFSLLVTLGLSAAALTVYGWTFYSQHRWGQQYEQLEELRRNERQMSAYMSVMKDDIASQAERSSGGLVPKSSATLIFVPPSANRNSSLPAKATKPAMVPTSPVGY
jgi:hypothetical protein